MRLDRSVHDAKGGVLILTRPLYPLAMLEHDLYQRVIEDTGTTSVRLCALVRAAVPSVRLHPVAERGERTGGRTKLGGAPELAHLEAWPAHDGRPLQFLAQLDLEPLARFDLDGLLPPRTSEREGIFVFVDLEDLARVRVRLLAGAFGPAATSPVESLGEVRLRPQLEYVLPELPRDLESELFDGWDRLQDALPRIQGISNDRARTTKHRALGIPDYLQGGGWDRQLLLQVGHDPFIRAPGSPATGLGLGDGGRLFIGLRPEALAACDLSEPDAYVDMS